MLLLALSIGLVYLLRADLGELGAFFAQMGGTVVSTYAALNPPTPVKVPAPPTIPQSSAKAPTAASSSSQYLLMGAAAALVIAAILFVMKSGGRRR